MKKSLLFFVTFFSLVSLFAQSQNYTVDMYALSNYSNEYYTVEKLDLQTPDGNEFCIMTLQKNGFSIQQSFADDHVLCISHLYFEDITSDWVYKKHIEGK